MLTNMINKAWVDNRIDAGKRGASPARRPDNNDETSSSLTAGCWKTTIPEKTHVDPLLPPHRYSADHQHRVITSVINKGPFCHNLILLTTLLLWATFCMLANGSSFSYSPPWFRKQLPSTSPQSPPSGLPLTSAANTKHLPDDGLDGADESSYDKDDRNNPFVSFTQRHAVDNKWVERKFERSSFLGEGNGDGRMPFVAFREDDGEGYEIEERKMMLKMNPCLSGPCAHGVCKKSPFRPGGYECFCEDGYTGYECQTDWNECWNEPCLNGATCFDAIAYPNCSCARGFTGSLCERKISPCDSSPCSNNATCVDDGPGNYTCKCLDGYEGLLCEVDMSYCNESRANNITLCLNDGICIDMEGVDFACWCAPGWTGRYCEVEIDECESSPCMYGGVCHDRLADYYCICPEMLTGKSCEFNMTLCQNKTCLNYGLCLYDPVVGEEICYCQPDYHTPDCSEKYNECLLGHNCMHGGICLDAVDGYHCLCPLQFTGKFCETEILPETTFPPTTTAIIVTTTSTVSSTATGPMETTSPSSISDELTTTFDANGSSLQTTAALTSIGTISTSSLVMTTDDDAPSITDKSSFGETTTGITVLVSTATSTITSPTLVQETSTIPMTTLVFNQTSHSDLLDNTTGTVTIVTEETETTTMDAISEETEKSETTITTKVVTITSTAPSSIEVQQTSGVTNTDDNVSMTNETISSKATSAITSSSSEISSTTSDITYSTLAPADQVTSNETTADEGTRLETTEKIPMTTSSMATVPSTAAMTEKATTAKTITETTVVIAASTLSTEAKEEMTTSSVPSTAMTSGSVTTETPSSLETTTISTSTAVEIDTTVIETSAATVLNSTTSSTVSTTAEAKTETQTLSVDVVTTDATEETTEIANTSAGLSSTSVAITDVTNMSTTVEVDPTSQPADETETSTKSSTGILSTTSLTFATAGITESTMSTTMKVDTSSQAVETVSSTTISPPTEVGTDSASVATTDASTESEFSSTVINETVTITTEASTETHMIMPETSTVNETVTTEFTTGSSAHTERRTSTRSSSDAVTNSGSIPTVTGHAQEGGTQTTPSSLMTTITTTTAKPSTEIMWTSSQISVTTSISLVPTTMVTEDSSGATADGEQEPSTSTTEKVSTATATTTTTTIDEEATTTATSLPTSLITSAPDTTRITTTTVKNDEIPSTDTTTSQSKEEKSTTSSKFVTSETGPVTTDASTDENTTAEKYVNVTITDEIMTTSPFLPSEKTSTSNGVTITVPFEPTLLTTPTRMETTTTTTTTTTALQTTEVSITTVDSFGCPDTLCQNGGSCLVEESSLNPFKCVCALGFIGTRCQHLVNATVPSFGPNSFLTFELDELTDSSVVEMFLGVHVMSRDGKILEAGDPDPFLNLSVQDGQILLDFSCGSKKVGMLKDNRDLVGNYAEVWIRLDLNVLAGHHDAPMCKASLRVNETGPASSVQQPSSKIGQKLRRVTIGRGFTGCLSILQINNQEIMLSNQASDGAGVGECGQEEGPDLSMGCPHNPCFNGGTCIRLSFETWKCYCPPGFEGDLCERKMCNQGNPCGKNSSCLDAEDLSPFDHKFCLCHYGFSGPLCDTETKQVTEPFFYGTLNGYSSYLAFLTPPELERRMQLRFHFAADNLKQRAILFYVGQQFPRRANPHFDFLAVGIRNGYLVILWNLGLGTSEVISPSPLDPKLALHTLKLTRIGNVAWVKVDTQPTVGGISPPFLADLNVHSLLYVGGHWSFNHSMLPEILQGYTGFRGCILDLQLRPADQSIFLGPVKSLGGRNVGHCSRAASDDKICTNCLNGGTCRFYGASVKCSCPEGFHGLRCELEERR